MLGPDLTGIAADIGAEAVESTLTAHQEADGRPRADGGWDLTFSAAYRRTVVVLALGFAALVAVGFMAFKESGATRQGWIFFVLYECLFGPMFVWTLSYCVDAFGWKVRLYDWGLDIEPLVGKRRRLAISDLERVSFSRLRYVYRFESRDGDSAWISVYRNGVGRLRALLEAGVPQVLGQPDAKAALDRMPRLPPPRSPAGADVLANPATAARAEEFRSGALGCFSAAITIGAPVAALLALGPRGWPTIDLSPLAWSAGCGAAVGAASFVRLRDSLAWRVSGALWAAFVAGAALVYVLAGANAVGDSSSPQVRRVSVVRVSSHEEWYTTLEVVSWRQGESSVSFPVMARVGDAVASGDQVFVTTRAGRFGWEWVAEVSPANAERAR